MFRMRRKVLRGSAAILLTGPFSARAQSFPSRPIRIVVGFAPGGANDILARTFSARLQEVLGQGVIVENRPGANSIVAAEHVTRAAADGYTLFVASNGALTINPAIYSRLPYSPEDDFSVLGEMAYYPDVLIVNNDSEVDDLESLRTLSAQRSLNHGVGASLFQLAGEYLAQQSGLRLTHVNYKGNGPVVTAVLSGEIDFAVVDVGSALAQVKSGRIKALAVTSSKRAAVLPEVPTVAELGIPGFEIIGWTCLVAPSGVPEAELATLKSAFAEVVRNPALAERLHSLGMEPGRVADTALLKRIASERTRWKALAKAANIRAD